MDKSQAVKILFARIHALEKLLVCYRIGKTPSEKLFSELEKTKKKLEDNVLAILNPN